MSVGYKLLVSQLSQLGGATSMSVGYEPLVSQLGGVCQCMYVCRI
jgi:hypothetical protein